MQRTSATAQQARATILAAIQLVDGAWADVMAVVDRPRLERAATAARQARDLAIKMSARLALAHGASSGQEADEMWRLSSVAGVVSQEATHLHQLLPFFSESRGRFLDDEESRAEELYRTPGGMAELNDLYHEWEHAAAELRAQLGAERRDESRRMESEITCARCPKEAVGHGNLSGTPFCSVACMNK